MIRVSVSVCSVGGGGCSILKSYEDCFMHSKYQCWTACIEAASTRSIRVGVFAFCVESLKTCLSIASDSSETIGIIIIKLGMVTASDVVVVVVVVVAVDLS